MVRWTHGGRGLVDSGEPSDVRAAYPTSHGGIHRREMGGLIPKRIVVFRFDRNPLVCRAHVTHMRRLNPGLQIHGLYGGPRGHKGTAFRLAGRRVLGLDTLWFSPRSGLWNSRHGDIALAMWYRDVGHRLDFDVLHFLEWDILLFEPLDQIFGSVPADAVGFTAPTPLSSVEEDWEWLRTPERRRQWEQLLAEVRIRWGYDQSPYACWGAGPCMPRAFIERYAALPPPEACPHEELRMPLFAQVLGFELANTGLRRTWSDPVEDPFFNLNSVEIEPSTIAAELAGPDGRRAFHPVRKPFRSSKHAAADQSAS
jgi:hypothetical protein